MNNEQAKDLIFDYVKGSLGEPEKRELEELLRNSDSLRRELKAAKAYYDSLGSLGTIKSSPDFLDKVNRKIDAKVKGTSLFRKLFMPFSWKIPAELAGVAVTVTLILLIYSPFHGKVNPPSLYEKESKLEQEVQSLQEMHEAAKSVPVEDTMKKTIEEPKIKSKVSVPPAQIQQRITAALSKPSAMNKTKNRTAAPVSAPPADLTPQTSAPAVSLPAPDRPAKAESDLPRSGYTAAPAQEAPSAQALSSGEAEVSKEDQFAFSADEMRTARKKQAFSSSARAGTAFSDHQSAGITEPSSFMSSPDEKPALTATAPANIKGENAPEGISKSKHITIDFIPFALQNETRGGSIAQNTSADKSVEVPADTKAEQPLRSSTEKSARPAASVSSAPGRTLFVRKRDYAAESRLATESLIRQYSGTWSTQPDSSGNRRYQITMPAGSVRPFFEELHKRGSVTSTLTDFSLLQESKTISFTLVIAQ